MSDVPQGEGWWQASDGKYYPPEQQTGAGPAPAMGGGAVTKLDVGQAITYGWNGFIKNIGAILIIWLIIIGVNLFFNIVPRFTDSVILWLLFWPIGWIVSLIVQAGLLRVGLAITNGQPVEPSLLWSTDNIGPYIVGSILYGLAVFVGLFALCIGALIVMFFLWFYGFFILDQGQGPTDGLTSSFNMVKDRPGEVFVFALVAILLTVVTCGLATPVVQIASAYAYKVLTGQQIAPAQ